MSSMSFQPMTADQIHASRAEQRKQRLLEAEMELAMEEAEALKMTEDQRQTLLRPFATVKAEFTDLDGLRWSQAALCMLSPQSPQRRAPPHVPPNTPADVLNAKSNNRCTAFNVLTRADLDCFSPEDTIRPSFSSSSSLVDLNLPNGNRHRDGSHTRSPIKGLFTSRQLGIENLSEASTTEHMANSSPLQTSGALRFAVELDDEDDSRIPVPPGLEVTPAPTPYSSPDPAGHAPKMPSLSLPSSPTGSLLEFKSTSISSSACLPAECTVLSLPSTPHHKSTLSSPRSRLRSLLHDDRSPSTPTAIRTHAPPRFLTALTPTSTPMPQQSRRPSLPTRSPSHLDLTSLCFYEDDDQTPTPSPITSRRPELY